MRCFVFLDSSRNAAALVQKFLKLELTEMVNQYFKQPGESKMSHMLHLDSQCFERGLECRTFRTTQVTTIIWTLQSTRNNYVLWGEDFNRLPMYWNPLSWNIWWGTLELFYHFNKMSWGKCLRGRVSHWYTIRPDRLLLHSIVELGTL